MILYDKRKIWLHTKSSKQREEWFKLFDELLELKEQKAGKAEAENTVCSKGLWWIGNFFTTFEEQMNWVKSGIEYFKQEDIGRKYSIKVVDL